MIKNRFKIGRKNWKFCKLALFSVFLFIAFAYGIITIQYKIFPFKQIRYFKNFFFANNTKPNKAQDKAQASYREYYLSKKSFFELHGRKAEVVMIGDSITDQAEWAELLKINSIVNRGIGGDTTANILNRMDSIYSIEPQKAFIMVGINDIFKGVDIKEIFENYKEIVNLLRNKNIAVYIQSTLLVGPQISQKEQVNNRIIELNYLLKKYSMENNIIFIDLNDRLSSKGGLNEQFTFDGIHLNGKGYNVWAEMIKPYI